MLMTARIYIVVSVTFVYVDLGNDPTHPSVELLVAPSENDEAGCEVRHEMAKRSVIVQLAVYNIQETCLVAWWLPAGDLGHSNDHVCLITTDGLLHGDITCH